jgi:hypothetical protein
MYKGKYLKKDGFRKQLEVVIATRQMININTLIKIIMS